MVLRSYIMDFNEKITNILNLSSFYKKNNTDNRSQYLLLEPIVVRYIGHDKIHKDKLIEYIDSLFKNKKGISESIINSHTTSKYIKYNKESKKYSLDLNDANIKNKLDKYNNINSANKEALDKLNSFIISKMSDSVKNDIDIFNISEYVYNFFYRHFSINKKNKIDDYDDEYSDIEKNIANILNECYIKYKDNINIFKNIIQGMVIIEAVENYKNSNLNNIKKPVIYVDNIFIQNLFGWCDEIYYESSKLILDIFTHLNFTVFLHPIKIELIEEYAYSAKDANRKEVKMNRFFFHIHQAYLDKNKLDIINNCNKENIHNKIYIKIKKCGIAQKNNLYFKDFNQDKNLELYNNVHEYRQKNNEHKGYNTNINDLQTKYDCAIINRYNIHKKDREDTLSNMDEIFLTYHSAIIKNTLFKAHSIYKPIMNIKTFIKLLLLESILSNIKENENLLDVFIINAYSGILSTEFSNFINRVYSETNISDDDRDLLLSAVYNENQNNEIIREDSDPNKMLKYIKNEEKKDKKEKRYLKNKLKYEKSKQLKIKKKYKGKLINAKNTLTNTNDELTNVNYRLVNAENKIANKNNAINILICVIAFLVSTILFILLHLDIIKIKTLNEANIIIKILISILPLIITSIVLFRKNIIKFLKYISKKEFLILINNIIEFIKSIYRNIHF